MARFSSLPQLRSNEPAVPTVRNAAGGQAYQAGPKDRLAIHLISSFMSGDYYQSVEQQAINLINTAVDVQDWHWCARAALYARDVLGMRTTSHLLTAGIGLHAHGLPWLREFYRRVVVRPDDMCEIAGAYMMLTGKRGKLPNAMKRGFADRFAQLDEYQLAKYKGGNRSVKLVDVMRLCHPKGDLIDRLARSELAVPNTWETRLSAAQTPAERRAVWTDLVGQGQLGYLALLRNLRNIARDTDAQLLTQALEQLQDVERMRRARVMPFQLYTALHLFNTGQTSGYHAPQGQGLDHRTRDQIVDGLSSALDLTLDIVPQFDGPTLVAVDTSGSMGSSISARSSIRCVEAGMLFAACLAKKNRESDIAVYADRAEIARFGTRNQPVSTIMDSLVSRIGQVGHGTNFASVTPLLHQGQYRRVFFMSDMQGWYGDIQGLNRWLNVNRTHCYLWNLHGDGTSQIDSENPRLVQLGGFSDRVFESVPLHEQGTGGLVQAINQIEL